MRENLSLSPVSNFQTLKSMSESLEWITMVGERTGKREEEGRELGREKDRKEGRERESKWVERMDEKSAEKKVIGMDNWNQGKRETYFLITNWREREREKEKHLLVWMFPKFFLPFSSHSISSFFLDTFSYSHCSFPFIMTLYHLLSARKDELFFYYNSCLINFFQMRKFFSWDLINDRKQWSLRENR